MPTGHPCRNESRDHRGSLGGLAAVNSFHRLGASVTVFEKRPQSMESNGACLGFVDVDLWEHSPSRAPNLRRPARAEH